MNSKKRVQSALAGEKTDRPLFCPAIYEHKAKLLGKSPSDVSRDARLLQQSVLAEYETYSPDILTVGIDIYNVEAEALGSTVLFPKAIDAVPVIKQRILNSLDDLGGLAKIESGKSGRMPLVLEAAEAVNKRIDRQVYVRGAISGPFSIASQLLGIEKLLIAVKLELSKVKKLMKICTDVAISYGKAFVKRGIEVCIFDSQTAPPLLSPKTYKHLVLPDVQRLVKNLKDAGAHFVAYIVGGDTTSNVENLLATGANIVLSDFASNIDKFLESTKDRKVLVRRNIDPALIEFGPDEKLRKQIKFVRELVQRNPRIIIGTGVLSYNTSIERVLMVKNMCLEGF
jgi:uroporphyrinogen decarboxylase